MHPLGTVEPLRTNVKNSPHLVLSAMMWYEEVRCTSTTANGCMSTYTDVVREGSVQSNHSELMQRSLRSLLSLQ